jgi:hypothetical protein
MNINKVRKELAVLLLLASGMANAGLITIGGLTLENAGDSYVTDHANNVDYLRWDQVVDFNYSELSTALHAGNAYEGWSIAGNVEANNFVNALLDGTSNCDAVAGIATCTEDYSFTDFTTLMGSSYDASTDYTLAWFLSDNDVGAEVGFIETAADGSMFKMNEWNSVDNSDVVQSQERIGFMLYRVHVEVPEPSTLAIVALGLMGLTSRRFKKQS